ncbi:MAG: FKBP-type peptidyl-prolyl cis-trans isomerase [Verrucomicrobiota bacterium]
MMKRFIGAILSCALLISVLGFEDKRVLKDQNAKVSYSIGLEIGSGMKKQKLDVDPELIIAGFRDGLSGTNPALSEAEIKEVMALFEKEMESRLAKESAVTKEKNKKDGENFLAANRKKDGVKVLPSGLQYKILKEGSGPSPKTEDQVTTHYRGTLIDGTEFDSSYNRNAPASFGVGQVIKGWQEALPLMKVGSKWQLFIPSDLAYGEHGASGVIGSDATLIFEIELLSIDKQ